MWDVVIVGAGAAGCFTAILLGQMAPDLRILVVEKTRQPLAKVQRSGGGRCNVTHHCFDPLELSKHYPRGKEFLRAAFHRFSPATMIEWLKEQGVPVVVESDGRCFPSTHSSQTVIHLFLRLLQERGIEVRLEHEVERLVPMEGHFALHIRGKETLEAKKVVLATGGMARSYGLWQELGHTLIPPVPSLFTFTLQEEWVKELSGSVAPLAKVMLEGSSFQSSGPLLLTHWGMSGPSILRLSAFAARWLAERNYQACLLVNWTGEEKEEDVRFALGQQKEKEGKKEVVATPLFSLSKQLWKALVLQVSPSLSTRVWAHISRKEIEFLAKALYRMPFHMTGKSIHKEEFVTAGGLCLDEMDPRTLESRKVPGLYAVGEVLDVDGVTGGFNFQNAWTNGYLVAYAISNN